MATFTPLSVELDGFWEAPFAGLPAGVQARVHAAVGIDWDDLSPAERQEAVMALDADWALERANGKSLGSFAEEAEAKFALAVLRGDFVDWDGCRAGAASGPAVFVWAVERVKDGWVDALHDCAKALFHHLERMPNATQVWIAMIESPPEGYGSIKLDGEFLTMPGEAPLTRAELVKRYRSYTSEKTPKGV